MNPSEQTTDNGAKTLKRICLASCRKLVEQLDQTKDAILSDFRTLIRGQEHMLRLAINEAEALAWQTEYPHLIFPTLALEKAQDLAAWTSRQRSIKEGSPMRAFAA